MKRDDFIFTIGYQGSTALVDRAASRKYGKLSTEELAKEGLFRAAFCSALYSEDEQEFAAFRALFERTSGKSGMDIDQMKRLFGVKGVPDNVSRVVNV